jgi:hypothetical protein
VMSPLAKRVHLTPEAASMDDWNVATRAPAR